MIALKIEICFDRDQQLTEYGDIRQQFNESQLKQGKVGIQQTIPIKWLIIISPMNITTLWWRGVAHDQWMVYPQAQRLKWTVKLRRVLSYILFISYWYSMIFIYIYIYHHDTSISRLLFPWKFPCWFHISASSQPSMDRSFTSQSHRSCSVHSLDPGEAQDCRVSQQESCGSRASAFLFHKSFMSDIFHTLPGSQS